MAWLRIISINLGVSALLVLAVELSLRFIYPEKTIASYWESDQPDFPKHVPNLKLLHPETGAIAQFDSFGMRRDIHQCADESNEIKILIVGDSNIAAHFVNDKDAPGNVLESILNSRSQRCFDVDSFGVSGLGPDQALFAAKHFTAQAQYDHVVLHLFGDNDLSDLIRGNYPLIDGRLHNDGYCLTEIAIWDRVLLLKAIRKLLYISFGWWPSKEVVGSKPNTRCMTEMYRSKSRSPLANPTLENILRHKDLDHRAFSLGLKSVFYHDRYDIEFACKTASKHLLEETRSRLEAVFREFLDMGGNMRSRLILLIQPSEYDVTENHHLNSGTFSSHCGLYDPGNLTAVFENSAGNVDLHHSVISLFEDFQACNDCYFTEEEIPGDNHWNAKGILVAMRLVAKRILRIHSGQ